MTENKYNKNNPFLWETHGIHVGTGKDHVKHGIDDVDSVVELAIEKGMPAVTFIIHTPRLTGLRYRKEKNTDVKFIRGDRSYFHYPAQMSRLKQKYNGQIKIIWGIELEWMGTGLGLQWNRSKFLHAYDADYVIGSVHFSPEGLPYDGSKEEAEELVQLRGGVENYWAGYIEEVIQMVTTSWDMIQVVGHLDLPKLHIPIPEPLLDLDHSNHVLARRMRTLLELMSSYNLALDIDLAGQRKGCGIYPDMAFLERARQLEIPISIGTDAHSIEDVGVGYREGIEFLEQTDYKYYVSFSKRIPRKRPIVANDEEGRKFKVLNIAMDMLNQRFDGRRRIGIPKFSFGGSFRDFIDDYRNSTSLGQYQAVRVRKAAKAVTISNEPPQQEVKNVQCLFSLHTDTPGTLSILWSTLASEGINVETAYLHPLDKDTATAYLTLSGDEEKIREAVDFIKGTASDRFLKLGLLDRMELPSYRNEPAYLLEVDGVDLPIPVSRHMILTVHNNGAGVLLILLSALTYRNINIIDLQLGTRGDRGYAILGVDGNERDISDLLNRLGPQFHEVSYLSLSSLDD